MTIQYPPACVTGFQIPVISPNYTYKIGETADTSLSTISPLTTGTCAFTAEVLNQDGSTIDSMFTFIAMEIDKQLPTWWEYATVTKEPGLTWYASSTDYSKEGTYDMKFVMTETGGAAEVQEVPFTVEVIDNPCVGAWTPTPTMPSTGEWDTTFELETDPPVTLNLNNIDHGEC